MSDYDFVDLGGNEVAELTPSFWSDPQRLFRAGERLKAKAAMSDARMEALAEQYAPKPQTPGIEAQLYRRVDEPFDAEAEAREARTRAAHFQIMRALELEKKEAEQKRQQMHNGMRAAARQTALGRLLLRRF
jgi:hypothetical protein